MTAASDPNVVLPSPGADLPCALLVLCVECGDAAELPLPLDQQLLALVLAQRGWFIAVLNAPDSTVEGSGLAAAVLGPICTSCAQQRYAPEVFDAAEQRRQQLLHASAHAGDAATQSPQVRR